MGSNPASITNFEDLIMDYDRLIELADHLDTLQDIPLRSGKIKNGFNMGAFFYECGTPACIAGWTLSLFGAELGRDATWYPYLNARNLLSLESETAEALFQPAWRDVAAVYAIPGEPGFISHSRAAAQLRYLANEGEVDWNQNYYPFDL